MNKEHSQKIKDYTNAYFSKSGEIDPSQREKLILTYTPLIKYIAARLAARLPAHVANEDLINCGIIGLIDAIEKFDISRNVQFKTYAEFRIKGAMLDELRSLDWVPRSIRRKITELDKTYSDLESNLGRPATDEEVAKTLNISLEDYHRLLDETKSVSFMDIENVHPKPADLSNTANRDFLTLEQDDPFSDIFLSQVRDIIANAIAELPEKEKLTVSLYYYDELTMKEIGEVLGYTESRISQMHSKAMLRLRTKLKKTMDV
jgi:RNA polymerase sigma factor for flagellar operon FliA